jgi:hypothetical protein
MAPWESEQQHCGSNYWGRKEGAAGHSAGLLCKINIDYWQVPLVSIHLDALRLLNCMFCYERKGFLTKSELTGFFSLLV